MILKTTVHSRRLTVEEQLKKRGLGDVVSAIATPIARAIGSDCIDPETNELRSGSPCSKRKAWLNSAVPFSSKT